MTRRKGGDRHSDETVSAVRADHLRGLPHHEVARRHGLSRNTVIKMVNRRHPYDVPFAVWQARHQDRARVIASRVGNPPRYLVVNTDPLVRKLFDVMHGEGMTVAEVARKSGVTMSSLQRWAHGRRSPQAFYLDCALQACGWRLAVVRSRSADGRHGRPAHDLPHTYTRAEVDAHDLGYDRGYRDALDGKARRRRGPESGPEGGATGCTCDDDGEDDADA